MGPRRWWAPLLATAALAVAGCGGDGNEQGGVARKDISIEVVTHGPAADPFWSPLKKGVETAEEDLGVEVRYRSPEKFDVGTTRRLVDSAIAAKPDGLAVSIPDAGVLGPSIRKAVKAGIPVVSLNSGAGASRGLGAIAHVGQAEREAGLAAGERMKAAGVTGALCVNHEAGNVGLDQRCTGFREGLGGEAEVLAVDATDPISARRRVNAALERRPEVNGILTLGPAGADPTIQGLEESRRLGRIRLATFDLSESVLERLRAGDLLFAVDQQQYLQGYLPVEILTLNAQLGVRPAADVRTGPTFVTKGNAARVSELSREGLR
jgi:simple sugar transport system substrate-binding protein